MLKRINKICYILILLILYICNVFAYGAAASTSYKDIKDTSYIYYGDISLTNITYKEIYADKAYIRGIISNSGKNDATYTIKVVYYTDLNEIIATSSINGFIENGEYLDFYIYTPVSEIDREYTLKDISKYKVTVEPKFQGETIGEINSNEEYTSDDSLKGYDFIIDNYKIDMTINENNTYEITEVLNVTFNESKHGIYRDIPLTNNVTRLDGTINSNRAQIKDIYVSDKYSKQIVGTNYRLKIGDASKYVYGKKQYVIKYTYNIGKDPLEGLDEVYFNLIGTEWEVPIKEVKFNISMPKVFDKTKIGFSSGKRGSVDNTFVDYIVENNTIRGAYNNILMPEEALTFRVELDEGYFVGAKLETSVFVFISAGGAILCLLVAIALWLKYGKDEQVIETVELYPPDKASPLDIAFMYKGYIEDDDVVSLLLTLANKGYISIEENNKGGSIFSSSDFVIRKLKEYNGSNDAEKIFMQGLFEKRSKINSIKTIMKALKSGEEVEIVGNTDGETVTSEDLRYSFYKTVERIKSMMNNKKNKRKIFETVASGISKWLIIMVIGIYLLITVPPILMYSEMGAFALPFAILFPLIGETIFIVMVFTPGKKVIYVNGIPTTSKIVSILFGGLFGGMFGGMPWCMIVLPCLLIEKTWLTAYAIGIISMMLILIINKYMPKRTKFGTEMLGRIRGFKRFLENAEKQELESMVYKNPEYFYDILPYAYVLGVSDKWIKQFESITLMPPNWYIGYNSFSVHTFGGFMDSTMRSASSAMTSSPPSSSGSSSGFSSSSAGGSSGGGSGGGGGGSW